MKSKTVTIFEAYGIYVDEDTPQHIFIDNPDIRVFIAYDVGEYAVDIIRDRAIHSATLQLIIPDSNVGMTFDDYVATQIAFFQRELDGRQKGHFLVIEHHGEMEGATSQTMVSKPEYDVYYGKVDSRHDAEARHRRFVSAVMAILMETRSLTSIERLYEATVLYNEAGKPGYLMSLDTSVVSHLSHRLDTKEVDDVGKRYPQFIQEETFQRVSRLLVASLNTNAEKLRTFQVAFSALEVFTNKVFKEYETELHTQLLLHASPNAWGEHLTRIRKVMSDKYRLTDKFTVIALQLVPNDADIDLSIFQRCKKARDNIAHGQDVNENVLPTLETQTLLKKYLRLHLNRRDEKRAEAQSRQT